MQRLLTAALLALLTVSVFWPVLGFPFLSYDDGTYVANNVLVRDGLSVEGLTWAFGGQYVANWHPLTWLSLMLDAELWGAGPGVFHRTNLLLHVVNVLLLYLLLERSTRAQWPAACAAALFAVHPLHVEPVAWISSRKDVLSTAFALLALLAYARWKKRGGSWAYAAALAALAASLLSKQMLVTAPALLVLLDLWPLQAWPATAAARRRSVLEKLPFLGLALAFAAAAFIAQYSGGAVADRAQFPVALRLANAVVVPVLYLRQAIWPAGLAALYRYPETIPPSHVAGAVLLLAAITAACIRQAGRRPYLLVGWCWYLITLLPVIGILQVGEQRMADRYTYVPLIGPFCAVSWLAASWATTRLRARILGATAIVLAGALAVAARGQLAHWRDSTAVFRRVLAVDEHNPSAHNNLGVELGEAGRIEEALPHLRAALRLRPSSPEALNNLGNALLQLGQAEEALQLYETALRLQPSSVHARMNVVLALQREGRHAEALREVDEVLALDPNREDVRRFAARAHRERGRALAREGHLAEATEHFRRTLALEPESWESHYDMGVALALAGSLAPAAEHYARAVELQPDRAALHDERGVVLMKLGRREEAIVHFRRAVELSPDYAPARAHLDAALRSPG
jgi:tetratricopeptide (TPR) repeat protein